MTGGAPQGLLQGITEIPSASMLMKSSTWPLVITAARGMPSLPSNHYLPSVPPTPTRCYTSDGDRRGTTRPLAQHHRDPTTVADCGRVCPIVADSSQLWPTLCSICFATVCDDVIVQVADTFWPTVSHCGRLWTTVGGCGRLWPTVADCGFDFVFCYCF